MAAGHGHEHGHEHGHGHGKMELPDYRQWKIEGTPLETVQKKLAARGLRDPWLAMRLEDTWTALQATSPS